MAKTKQKKLMRKMNSIKGSLTTSKETCKTKEFVNFELDNGMSLTVFEIDNKRSLALGVNVALLNPDLLMTGVTTFDCPLNKTYELARDLLGYSMSITGKATVPILKLGEQDYFMTTITRTLPSTTKDRQNVIALLNRHLNKYGLSTKDYGIK